MMLVLRAVFSDLFIEVKPGVFKTGTFMAWCELDR
jgi:hypothetical protein